MKNKGFKITAIILTLAVTLIAHPFSIVHAAGSASATLRTSYGQSYDLQGNIYEYHRYITINIDGYASGTAQLTLSNSTSYDIISYNCQTIKSGTFLSISFEHEKFIYIELVSHGVAAAPDISSWTMSATLDDDPLDEIIYREGIIYTELLDIHQMLIENLDTYIDTISWKPIQLSFNGWTSNFSTYDTTQNKLYSGGYYEFGNFDIFADEHRIYRLKIPIKGEPAYTIDSFNLYLRYNNRNTNFVLSDYIFEVDQNFICYYFFFDSGFLYSNLARTLLIQYQASGPSSSTRYTYNTYLSLEYINDSDIEYWTLRSAIKQDQILRTINNISLGSNETTTTNNINSITSDLNDQISASNSATSSTEALLNNFNQNMDLNDYNFSISTGDHVTYFKQKLTDIYEIDEFKPFYLIPIILFVLGRILAG